MNDLAKELREQYNFQVELIRNPTKRQVLDKITAINAKRYGKDDQVLFFFSMHGLYDKGLYPYNGVKVEKQGKKTS